MSLQAFERSPLVGAPVVREILGAVVMTAVAVAVVWAATSTSRRVCEPAPNDWYPPMPDERCASLQLEPSPLVAIALVVVLVVSIWWVLRRASTADQSRRILSRAVTAVVVITAGTVVVSQVWLWWFGYLGYAADGNLMTIAPPFPFAGGSVDDDTLGAFILG
ncbi:hypothetical protein ACIQLK_01390 [Microbacterium sp. NPDC091382]|uniref:hypothetical protein n=1 Tax=Microbacterium sp. NPDC091382 TaxID=3364210 RepID=UPI003813F0E8